jgi:hypothetical protein
MHTILKMALPFIPVLAEKLTLQRKPIQNKLQVENNSAYTIPMPPDSAINWLSTIEVSVGTPA